MEKIDLSSLKPYGDTSNDGALQLSFTLPVKPCPKAREAAQQLVQSWGFTDIKVAHISEVGEGFSFFVVFAKTQKGIDYEKVKVSDIHRDRRSYKEIDKQILSDIRRAIRVVGACTGFDAHTVGLDAILSMKGFDGDVGLERYKGFDVVNMGSQVPAEKLIEKAIAFKADAILVSKVVSQKDIHVHDLRDVISQLKKRGLDNRFILVAGGPRVTHQIAAELGFDAGFTVGAYPSDVADFILHQMLKRKKSS